MNLETIRADANKAMADLAKKTLRELGHIADPITKLQLGTTSRECYALGIIASAGAIHTWRQAHALERGYLSRDAWSFSFAETTAPANYDKCVELARLEEQCARLKRELGIVDQK